MDDPSRVSGAPHAVPDIVVRAHKLDAVGRLVPGVIHELNNPLSAIVGFGELIRTDPRLPADLHRHAELLVRETTRTQRLIQATLEFLRARPPERMPTSIRALVDAVLLLHGYRLLSSSIHVEQDVSAELAQVEIDRSSLQLVLIDLVQEAIDVSLAAGGEGRLRIEAAQAGERGREAVTLTVSWTAGDASGDRSTASIPLGLDRETARRVAAAIVADHGGRLRTSRNPDGRGATTTIELPVRAGSAEPAVAAGAGHAGSDDGDVIASMSMPASAPPARAVAATRILVLDDEGSIRLLLEKWLRAAGFEPVIASTGEEALALVRDAPFEAVLCDHRMAGMNGTDVFEAVVAIRPELARRFVFMSGDVLNPQLRDFVQAHGVGLLAKPFDLTTVQRTLDGVLAGDDSGSD